MLTKIKYLIEKNFLESREINECDINIEEMDKMQKNGAILLDVRSPQEYSEGHIVGAISMPTYELKKKINRILQDKNQTIIVYCSTGIRSKKALKELKKMGYIKVYNLYKGLENY